MIRAIIFDMNGVIVDDEPLHEIAFKETCRQFGKVLTTDDYRRLCMGRGDFEGTQAVTQELGISGVTIEKFYEIKQQKYYELSEKELIPGPGLIDALKRLQSTYKLAVASSVRRSDIEYVLNRFQITAYFSALVGRDEVDRGKPDPDIYLEAASRLGIASQQCLVVEDSLTGIKAAKNAGMLCLGITTTHTAEELTSADGVIDSFDQLTKDFMSSLR